MKKSIVGLKKIIFNCVLFTAAFVIMFLLYVGNAEAAKSKYYIKVNRKTNVATIYNVSNNKPIKACLVSCGGGTPNGTFKTKNKYKWRPLFKNVHGQYATRITGSIMFHSVYYYKSGDKSTQSTVEYNKLGTTASMGCVRMSVEDAKWVYDNCPLGTKVIIFKGNSKKDPLGKPKLKKVSTKSKRGWDPTDPDKKNPYNKISYKGVSSGTKEKSINSTVNILQGVSAQTKWGRKLTSAIKVTVKAPGDKKHKSTKIKKLKLSKKGTYEIKYSVKDNKTGLTKGVTVKYKAKDNSAPTISGVPSNKSYEQGTVIGIRKGISAKNVVGTNLTSKIVVKIKKPGQSKYAMTLGKELVLNNIGKYNVEYSVTNPENKKVVKKVVTYNCVAKKVTPKPTVKPTVKPTATPTIAPTATATATPEPTPRPTTTKEAVDD